MYNFIRWIAVWLVRLTLGSSTGRHRAAGAGRSMAASGLARLEGAPCPGLPSARSPYGLDRVLDGGASPLVRPYLLASDRERAQGRRRLDLVRAADFGLGLDPCVLGEQGAAA